MPDVRPYSYVPSTATTIFTRLSDLCSEVMSQPYWMLSCLLYTAQIAKMAHFRVL